MVYIDDDSDCYKHRIQIPGFSADKAEAVIVHFPTPKRSARILNVGSCVQPIRIHAIMYTCNYVTSYTGIQHEHTIYSYSFMVC